MKLERLKQLKQMLSREKKLDKVWLYYMDNFADHEAFTNLGQPTHNPFLEAVIAAVAKQLFKQTAEDILLISIPEHKFIHGGFMVKGRIGGIIYFEQIKMGMTATSELPPSQQVHYSRFSGQQMRSSPKADLN